MLTEISRHALGPILARYVQPTGTTRCELQLIPVEMADRLTDPRGTMEGRLEIAALPPKFHPVPADSPNSLVQVSLREDDSGSSFASGVTLAEGMTMTTLDYVRQKITTTDDDTTIATTFADRGGRFRCIHRLSHRAGEAGLRSAGEFVNESSAPLELELLTSFALNSLTPFASANSTPHLRFHRFRSWWSTEGRVDSTSLGALHLERSWGGFSTVAERFGQVGTMPVRHWFPTAAVEDRTAGVVWAAQLAWAGSWQMELFRRGDRVSLYGGLADYEFGHWMKSIAPGEHFTSPPAYLTVVVGTLDDACHALLDGQRSAANHVPAVERNLPTVFNEWCTSWGHPTHESILAVARRLRGSGITYIVIDDGWAKRPPQAKFQSNGDWIVDEEKFPGGLKPTCDSLREMGFTPGIWFEFEVANPSADVWNEEEHFVQRHGRPLRSGTRRFLDLNDPWVTDYLTRKMIDLIRDSGIGYLKVDYNDNLGLGCDHPDSLGEGLRRHVEGIHRFFKIIREELPDLVIENCSSGGHRLEPSMQALTSMGSFSDAHEATIIPMIARNLQRLILPSQSLVWAVLHPADSNARLHYSLAATFLGRVCLSGNIHDLSDDQLGVVRRSLALYERVRNVIKFGKSDFHGDEAISYVDPVGWQAVIRVFEGQALLVAHGFGLPTATTVELALPPGDWKTVDRLTTANNAFTNSGGLTLGAGFEGAVWLLAR